MASKYQIRADGEVLADLMHPEYSYYNGKLKRGVNIAGSLTFTLMPNNPVVSSVMPLKSTITLRKYGRTIWSGRVVKSEKNIYNQYKLTCEGALSWLYDIMIAPTSFVNMSVSDIISSLITFYNSLCSEKRGFKIGNIEGENIITLSNRTDYTKVFDILSEIISINGGYFILSYEQDGTPILNYYKTGIPTENEIRFGENLLDINEYIDTTQIITALYATGNGISLPSLGYIENDNAVSTYGRIFGSINFDNITTEDELIMHATAYLKENMLGNVSIKVKAAEITWTASEGNMVRVISTRNGIDVNMIISEIDTDLNNATNNLITIGTNQKNLTKTLSIQNKK